MSLDCGIGLYAISDSTCHEGIGIFIKKKKIVIYIVANYKIAFNFINSYCLIQNHIPTSSDDV